MEDFGSQARGMRVKDSKLGLGSLRRGRSASPTSWSQPASFYPSPSATTFAFHREQTVVTSIFTSQRDLFNEYLAFGPFPRNPFIDFVRDELGTSYTTNYKFYYWKSQPHECWKGQKTMVLFLVIFIVFATSKETMVIEVGQSCSRYFILSFIFMKSRLCEAKVRARSSRDRDPTSWFPGANFTA